MRNRMIAKPGWCSPTGCKSAATRADGYRALGRLGAWTFGAKPGTGPMLWTWFAPGMGKGHRSLPQDWLDALDAWECLDDYGRSMGSEKSWRDYRSRRGAEDAAARAFAQLPPERRTGLLAGGHS